MSSATGSRPAVGAALIHLPIREARVVPARTGVST
jgi:hypothetical protein